MKKQAEFENGIKDTIEKQRAIAPDISEVTPTINFARKLLLTLVEKDTAKEDEPAETKNQRDRFIQKNAEFLLVLFNFSMLRQQNPKKRCRNN